MPTKGSVDCWFCDDKCASVLKCNFLLNYAPDIKRNLLLHVVIELHWSRDAPLQLCFDVTWSRSSFLAFLE